MGKRVKIERFHAGAVPHGGLDIIFCEDVGSGKNLSKNRSAGKQRGGGACAKTLPAACRKGGLFREDGLTFFTNAQIGGLVLCECPPHRGAQLRGVCRSENIHAWQTAHNGKVLERVMRGSQRGIRKTAARADNRNRHVVVAHIEFDLLQATRRNEGCDRVANWAQAAGGKAGSEGDHIRLGNAAIVKAGRHGGFELVEKAIPDVTTQDNDAFVSKGEFEDFIGEGVAHEKGEE